MEFYYLVIGIYSIFLMILAWYRFKYALGIFILSLPTYLLRFSIGPFPSTVLELSFGIIFLVWCIKYGWEDLRIIKKDILEHKFFFVSLVLFLFASILGIVVSDMVLKSAGQWRAYFLEPILLFFILLGRRRVISARDIIWFLSFSTLSVSVYSVIQYFTGWGIATPEWTRPETRRVTAFFTSPNAVGLYLGPIVILLLVLVGEYLNIAQIFKVTFFRLILPRSLRDRAARLYNSLKKLLTLKLLIKREKAPNFFKHWKVSLLILIGFFSLVAILFTKSEGTVFAVGAGVLAAIFFLGFRKSVLTILIMGVIICVIIPPLRSAVLFQDKPGQNRLTLWSYSWNYLTQSPKNFVLGAGVRQFFRKIQKPHYDVKKMERLIYPHNIILNFWTEIGFLGMISFVGIMGYLIYLGKQTIRRDIIYGAGLLGAMVVLIVHGLVDVPYFKNDLAMLFWIIASLFFTSFGSTK